MSFHHLPQRRGHPQIQTDIQAMIQIQGFAILHVCPSEKFPAFAYTIGLAHQTTFPELIINGFSSEARVSWLLELGFQMKGPPPAYPPSLMQIHFPPGGRCFVPGVRYHDLALHNLPLCLGEVEPRYYPSHVGQALAFYGHANFPLWQIAWPDPQGRFPWEEEGNPSSAEQCVFFDPHRYLPLKDASDQ